MILHLILERNPEISFSEQDAFDIELVSKSEIN
jgi:hypothetical protein